MSYGSSELYLEAVKDTKVQKFILGVFSHIQTSELLNFCETSTFFKKPLLSSYRHNEVNSIQK